MDAKAFLNDLMSRFKSDRATGVPRGELRKRIEGWIGTVDAEGEGYSDPSVQRDLSIKFHWGHHHDFGDFKLRGRLKNRHIDLLTWFIEEGALPRDLSGKTVLDIGCWTGGTTLLLSAMGARVVAVEEVRKYAEAVRYLAQAFEISTIEVQPRSFYELNGPDFNDRFDYVLFAGVIYHLTDPIVGARIVYNALKDGGTALVETMGSPNEGNKLEYFGPTRLGAGSGEELNRGGWNWFTPSPIVLERMLRDSGFSDVRTSNLVAGRRIYAVAGRDHHRDINRAGLSVPHIR